METVAFEEPQDLYGNFGHSFPKKMNISQNKGKLQKLIHSLSMYINNKYVVG